VVSRPPHSATSGKPPTTIRRRRERDDLPLERRLHPSASI
jgi:hypothetical protein